MAGLRGPAEATAGRIGATERKEADGLARKSECRERNVAGLEVRVLEREEEGGEEEEHEQQRCRGRTVCPVAHITVAIPRAR